MTKEIKKFDNVQAICSGIIEKYMKEEKKLDEQPSLFARYNGKDLNEDWINFLNKTYLTIPSLNPTSKLANIMKTYDGVMQQNELAVSKDFINAVYEANYSKLKKGYNQ